MTYSEKLKHPLWQRKRLEVMQRDGWKCLQCNSSEKTLNVHHIKYVGDNPWDTPSEFLKTLCEDCHEAAHTPMQPLVFYFAGKISHTCWRHSLVSDLRDSTNYEDLDLGTLILERAIDRYHHYCGPFFISCDHGCYHGDGHHGRKQLDYDCSATHHDYMGRDAAYRNCYENLIQSTAVFAWIDSMDCYGTIFELGLASQLGKPIYIGVDAKIGKQVRDQMWFALHRNQVCVAASAKDAFFTFFPPF